MIRHTGGFAIGATSTRSRSMLAGHGAGRREGLMPSWSPSGPMRRTSRARMRSLYRCSGCCGGAMADHSCAMGGPPCSACRRVGARREAAATEDTTAHATWSPSSTRTPLDRRMRPRWWPGGGLSPTSPRLSADRVRNVSDEADDDLLGHPTQARADAPTSGDPRTPAGGWPRCRPRSSSPTTSWACTSWPRSTSRPRRPDLRPGGTGDRRRGLPGRGPRRPPRPRRDDDARRAGQHPPGVRRRSRTRAASATS